MRKHKRWVSGGAGGHLPSHDDDKVQLVPPVTQVTVGAEDPQRHHLDDHFHGEEREDAVVQHLKSRASGETRKKK